MTVEQMIRYVAYRLEAVGVVVRPPRISRLVRGFPDLSLIRSGIDSYLDARIEGVSWSGFELYVNGYADPTGSHAARNVDNAQLSRTTRSSPKGTT